jgi:arylsulfatase A-like enzyme
MAARTILRTTAWLLLPIILQLIMLVSGRPNIIVMQPDDFQFLLEWDPPAHVPGAETFSLDLPNINRLRTNGLQMTRAYTTAPSCGTSRYSTMTGRYPSRSSFLRQNALDWEDEDIAYVTIPTTKLVDIDSVSDGQDCSQSNMAVLFQSNGYATGMFGKWHLFPGTDDTYDYETHRSGILECGFDTAEAIYWHNMRDEWTDGGAFSHNTEYMTQMALEFMEDAVSKSQNFFVYFNPTAPHESGNVWDALTEFSCMDTPAGRLDEEPSIPGMTEGIGCEAYRQTVIDRANGDKSNTVLGSIWVDDAVGALLQFLESKGILENTIFLFQQDHGQEAKFSIFEGGVRIPQFIHYPNEIPAGSVYNELVSTIDIAPTLADFAGITSSSPGWYNMDGRSWRSLKPGLERCLVVELDYDHSVICKCKKLLRIGYDDDSNTLIVGQDFGFPTTSPGWFDLCDDNREYLIAPDLSPERFTSSSTDDRLTEILNCHIAATRPVDDPVYGSCDSLSIKATPAPTLSPLTAVATNRTSLYPTRTTSPSPQVFNKEQSVELLSGHDLSDASALVDSSSSSAQGSANITNQRSAVFLSLVLGSASLYVSTIIGAL